MQINDLLDASAVQARLLRKIQQRLDKQAELTFQLARVVDHLAEANLQREECAQIAEAHEAKWSCSQSSFGQGKASVAADIAAAIRAGRSGE